MNVMDFIEGLKIAQTK